MEFRIKAHYFDRYVNVIADDNWQEVIKRKNKKNATEEDYSDWIGGFIIIGSTWYICLPSYPLLNEVVHETVHFVNKLFAHIGYYPDVHNDEVQCYMIGYFSEEIYKKIYNIKKIK